MTVPRLRLNRMQTFQLMQLIQEEFVKQGVSDETFAAFATEKLGFIVNDRNVQGCRTDLGIESVLRATQPKTVLARLEALEARIAQLEKEWRS